MRQAIAFLRDPAIFSAGDGLARGDFYRLRVPGYTIHVVTDPAAIEQILVTDSSRFEKSRIYWRELRRIIGDAMGSIDGARWQYLRQLQSPLFTPKAVQGYLPTVERITVSRLEQLASEVTTERTIAISELLSELNTRILLAVLFGHESNDEAVEIAHRIADGEATIAWRSKFPWRPLTAWLTGANQRAARHKRFFDAYADRVRTSPAAHDQATLLYAILSVARDTRAPRYPRTLLRNEIIVHLGAGTETQAVAEGWILYLLWKHPDVLERARAEIAIVADGSLTTMGHVPRLTYTRQVVREALRLYPPSYALVRDCVRATEVGKHQLKAGDVVFISVCGLHRNPRLWDQAESFDPDRFDPDRAATIGKYQYLPFGAGGHTCIGQHLAVPCLTFTTAQFAQRFSWSFDDPDVRPVGLSTLKPAGSLTARFTILNR